MSKKDEIRRRHGAPTMAVRTFPTRNDPLNAHLGGGLEVGAVNEVWGEPDLFKTTLLAELVADVLAAGGYAVVADREGRITRERLQSLGADPDHPRLLYRGNYPHVLTVERVFDYAAQAIADIRAEDAARVAARIKAKKKDPELIDRYRALVRSSSSKPAALANLVEKFPHLVAPEDATIVAWVVDSVTATPSNDELLGTRGRNDDKDEKDKAVRGGTPDDRMEMKVRGGYASKSLPGANAQAWSTAYRRATFIDHSVVALMTAQTRMRSIGVVSWKGPAESNAQGFYGRNVINVRRGDPCEVYLSDSGALEIGGDARGRPAVGRRLLLDCKKVVSGARFVVPSFMVGAYGTDRPNTVWDYLTSVSLVVRPERSSKYALAPSASAVAAGIVGEGDAPPEQFTRAEFVSELYARHLDVWSKLVRDAAARCLRSGEVLA